ncbi:dauer larva development regulatory growth factor daf-7-like isoform X2 [Varroa jacobsoni]|uniref:dauer larva development regulatory growth factor daf-7-like isoform X2 n=1 Tax=Varroa jacobsoni TaxID=62625 RepID=UPI000BF58AAF|nr:dauer larva development regulatory growth factor daf-7-like isoform X2 [Varroa jacobsoni]
MCGRCRIALPKRPLPTHPTFMSATNSKSALREVVSCPLAACSLWSLHLRLIVTVLLTLAGSMADAAATRLVGVNSINSSLGVGPMSPALLHRLAWLPAMTAVTGSEAGQTEETHSRSSASMLQSTSKLRASGDASAVPVIQQAVMEQQKHQPQQQRLQRSRNDTTAYELPDSVLLDYVKVQMLRGLGLYEAPRVRRAARDSEYHRVYEEYRRRLEEDDLLDESENEDKDSQQGSAAALQRLYTIRATGLSGVNAEENGFTHNVQLRVPEAARLGFVSAKLRLRKIPAQCAVRVYKIEDGLRSLVADLQIMTGSSLRNRGAQARRVVDLTSSVKSWLRINNVIQLQLWGSRRGCLRQLPTFDVMATDLSSRGRSKRSADSIGNPTGPYQDKLGSSKRMCKGDKDKVCCLRLLNVTIADLGWEDWIVEPKHFQAYFCRGQCFFRHGRFASSHAALQSKMSRLLGPKTVPRPCCAPKKFKPLPVMYRDRQGNTHFGRIPKMIVKECACH